MTLKYSLGGNSLIFVKGYIGCVKESYHVFFTRTNPPLANTVVHNKTVPHIHQYVYCTFGESYERTVSVPTRLPRRS